MSDVEMLMKMELESQLKFARNKIVELQDKIKELEQENSRLSALLRGDDEMMNSLKTRED